MKKLISAILILALLSPVCFSEGIKLFIGQDLGAVGGLENYKEGYVDAFGVPDGVTSYTSLPSLAGLEAFANWGAGDVNAKEYVDCEAFKNAEIAIGLYIVGQTNAISKGLYDDSIKRLGEFIKNSGRTVYLRIGYEFDGAWNGYDPEEYIASFKRIVDVLKSDGVENFETVWQSSGNGGAEYLIRWYPGDEYVDWMGYSYFDGAQAMIGRGILKLAREHEKPVFIAEATPKKDNLNGNAELIWKAWYEPFLKHLNKNKDVIGAISYINCNWNVQPMWFGQGWGDSRIQVSEYITQKWQEEFLNSGLFD